MTKVVSNYTNLGPTSEHSNGMNAVPGPGTMFFDHQQRHREGGEAKLLASFCPSVRSSFALGEFRAANLFVPSLSLLSTYSLSSDPIRCNDAAADPFQ